MAENTEFIRQQQRAIERMKEMSKRGIGNGTHGMPPTPSFVKVNTSAEPPSDNIGKGQNTEEKSVKNKDILSGLNLPFLDSIKKEPDVTIIIGLLLLLWSEKGDKMLILALLYLLF